jgi:SPOR domain/Pilus formation protein N terminal region
MKRLLVAAFALFALAARGDNVTVHVRESVTIDIDGATAAYAIDADVVDVTVVRFGSIALTGRSAGTTQLIAVTAIGTKAFLVTVGAAPSTAMLHGAPTGNAVGNYEARYNSGTSQLLNSFDVFMRDGDRRSQFHLLNIRYLGRHFGNSSTAFPSIFYRVTTPDRELTLLDDYVDASPLTVHGTQVRGIHLIDHTLEIHAGYAAATLYEDLFLPADRRWVAGAGYGIDRGGIRWTPSVYVFFSEPKETTARSGVAGTLAAEYRRADALWLRGEIGVSGAVAGAADLRYDSANDHLLGHATFKPDNYPTLGLSEIPGGHGEFSWTRRVTARLIADTFASYDDYHLQSLQQTFSNGSVTLRYAATPRVTLTTGAAFSDLRTTARSIRTISIPAGISYDRPAFGASLSARILDNDNTSHRGDVIRIGARTTSGGFTTNLWVERQRQAPTLDLIFREEPGLALALARLGISVHTPEEIARVLRDNAALVNLGYIEGLTVNLTPLRLQAGFDASWIGPGEGRDQLRFHALADRDESVGTTRTAMIGTLSYSRRVLPQTDLFGSLSWWRSGAPPLEQNGKAVEAGVRQRFDGVPAMLQRRSTIEGVVFLDPEMRGTSAGATPLPDIIVTLDDTRTTKSDERGTYAFRNVDAGSHSVVAQLPPSRPAYFTTASRAGVHGRAHVDFGLVWSDGRLNGLVVSDAHVGIGGITIAATASNDIRVAATTDSGGRFALDVPAGTYRLALVPETLPAGYATEEAVRTITLAASLPQTMSFAVRALRSVSGTITGAREVTIESLGRHAAVDADGNFVFRSLPAGRFALTASVGGRVVTRAVVLPAEPASLHDIAFDAAVTTVASSKASATPAASGFYVVQLGAFRDPGNARQLATRLTRLGEIPFTDRSEGLLLVRTGPFASRTVATIAAERLRRVGIEGYVLSR